MIHSSGRRQVLGVAMAAMAIGVTRAYGAGFPEHPITLIVPFPPGGGTDALGRLLAQRMSPLLGQSIVVENIAGATGTIGSNRAAHGPADGYTLLLGISGTHAIAPSLYHRLPYDPVKDFVPVAELATIGNVLAVNPSIPVHNVKELIAWSRTQPGGGAYGSWGVGSGGHLAMEIIKSQTGMQMTHVPYKGAMLALSDTVSGQIPVSMTDVTSAAPFYKAGKIRVIAVTGSKRAPNMPDVPTLAEQGIHFDTDSWYALFAPARTPPDVLATLQSGVAKVMQEPDIPKRLNDLGLNPATLTPGQFAVQMKKDIATWAAVVRASGATAD